MGGGGGGGFACLEYNTNKECFKNEVYKQTSGIYVSNKMKSRDPNWGCMHVSNNIILMKDIQQYHSTGL